MNINDDNNNSKVTEKDEYNPFSSDSIWAIISGVISAILSGGPVALEGTAGWSLFQIGEAGKQMDRINEEWEEWDAKISNMLLSVRRSLKDLQRIYDERIKEEFIDPEDIAYDWYTKGGEETRDVYSKMLGLQKMIFDYKKKIVDKTVNKSFSGFGFPFNLLVTYPYDELKELSELSANIDYWLPNIKEAVKRLGEENESQRCQQEQGDEWLGKATKYYEDYLNPYIEEAPDVNEIWSPKGRRDPFVSVLPSLTSENKPRDPFLPIGMPDQKNKNYDVSSYLSSQYGFNLLEPLKELEDLQQGMVTYDDYFATLNDIMSSFNLPLDISSILGDSYTNDLPGSSLFQSAGSSAGSGFTLGSGITIPLEYNINVSGLEEFGALDQVIDESSKSIEQTAELAKSATSSIMGQYQNLTEEQVSLNNAMSALNFSGIGMPFVNISTYVEDADKNVVTFSDRLSNVARYAGQIGGAFMSVDEEIGKAISSAGTLTEGVAGIFKAFEGDEVNGIGLMQGIQGGFAGLQGLFGGEAGSDSSQLLGGMGGVGAGIAGLLTANPLEGITSLISGIPALLDGLTKSTQEGYTKQLSKQGFDDTYSEGLLDKMSAVSDQKGDKSFGIKAYIEDFFKETDIDTKDEFGRMSDLLSESIGEYVSQGHTMDEAYGKFGDELEQLTSAQEKYGFETVSSLSNMLDIQKSQTKEGRIEGLQGAIGGYDKIISGIEKQMKLTPDFKLSGASISGIAGSLTNTYQELLNQGMGAGEAVDAVKPLLTEYAGMAEKQGWDLSKVPGFSQLSSYFDSLDKSSGALDMISGSADVVKALSGSGLMDQATLESQGSLGMDVMNQLEASGLNDTQVLQQMGGWLQSMQTAAEKSGLGLDPEIQALIARAEEKGVLPEEVKPVGEVIAEGIETGFTKAIDVIDKYFGGLAEFGEGGTVPGSSGQRKLIWAHAGEAVGYPAELSKLASNPELAQGFSGVAGMFAAAMQNTGVMLAAASGGTESIAATLQNLAESGKFNLEELQARAMENSPNTEYSIAMDRITRQSSAEMEQRVAAERQAVAESNKLEIAQTIENNMKIVINDREFVQTLKNELYNQIKEDSKRGMIKIHSKAIDDY